LNWFSNIQSYRGRFCRKLIRNLSTNSITEQPKKLVMMTESELRTGHDVRILTETNPEQPEKKDERHPVDQQGVKICRLTSPRKTPLKTSVLEESEENSGKLGIKICLEYAQGFLKKKISLTMNVVPSLSIKDCLLMEIHSLFFQSSFLVYHSLLMGIEKC
jgi:hypothetical protein